MGVYDQEVARCAALERCHERTSNQIAFFQHFDELVSTLLLCLPLYFLFPLLLLRVFFIFPSTYASPILINENGQIFSLIVMPQLIIARLWSTTQASWRFFLQIVCVSNASKLWCAFPSAVYLQTGQFLALIRTISLALTLSMASLFVFPTGTKTYGVWSQWSVCSCSGFRTRTRACYDGTNTGQACSSLTDSQTLSCTSPSG